MLLKLNIFTTFLCLVKCTPVYFSKPREFRQRLSQWCRNRFENYIAKSNFFNLKNPPVQNSAKCTKKFTKNSLKICLKLLQPHYKKIINTIGTNKRSLNAVRTLPAWSRS